MNGILFYMGVGMILASSIGSNAFGIEPGAGGVARSALIVEIQAFTTSEPMTLQDGVLQGTSTPCYHPMKAPPNTSPKKQIPSSRSSASPTACLAKRKRGQSNVS
jgi:hypothetical protein